MRLYKRGDTGAYSGVKCAATIIVQDARKIFGRLCGGEGGEVSEIIIELSDKLINCLLWRENIRLL